VKAGQAETGWMKANFHKNQRVYVKPVGTWAAVEKVVPQWAKGIDEPLRIFYDVGLGREFAAEELQAEQPLAEDAQRNAVDEPMEAVVDGFESRHVALPDPGHEPVRVNHIGWFLVSKNSLL